VTVGSRPHVGEANASNLLKMEALNHAMAMIKYGPQGIVLYANQKFFELTGYARDEVLGQHHRIFLSTAGADATRQEL